MSLSFSHITHKIFRLYMFVFQEWRIYRTNGSLYTWMHSAIKLKSHLLIRSERKPLVVFEYSPKWEETEAKYSWFCVRSRYIASEAIVLRLRRNDTVTMSSVNFLNEHLFYVIRFKAPFALSQNVNFYDFSRSHFIDVPKTDTVSLYRSRFTSIYSGPLLCFSIIIKP